MEIEIAYGITIRDVAVGVLAGGILLYAVNFPADYVCLVTTAHGIIKIMT